MPVVPNEPLETNVPSFGKILVPGTAGMTFIPAKFVITAEPKFFPELALIIWFVPVVVDVLVRLLLDVVKHVVDAVVPVEIHVVGRDVISFSFIGVPLLSATMTLVVGWNWVGRS